jgi:predicted methyltransferase
MLLSLRTWRDATVPKLLYLLLLPLLGANAAFSDDAALQAAIDGTHRAEAKGFFNLNPMDNKRYEIGAWQLPPSLRGLESEGEKAPCRTIGQSERMTLVFRKP